MSDFIEIKEECRIPGTDIVLEAGDKIQVAENTIKTTRGEFNIEYFVKIEYAPGPSRYRILWRDEDLKCSGTLTIDGNNEESQIVYDDKPRLSHGIQQALFDITSEYRYWNYDDLCASWDKGVVYALFHPDKKWDFTKYSGNVNW